MKRPLAALAAAVLATLVLAGCVPSFLVPRPDTSTPTGESVSAELEPFYGQVVEWERCDALQCATVEAPLDWSDPAAGSIELALVRSVASGERLGSLLVNPGGPGGSGFDFIADSLDYAVGQPLREHYDVVGFDPRGVNRSTGVACFDPAEMDEYLYSLPEHPRGTDEWIAEAEAGTAAFGAACLERTGELLGNVDTESAARDMDLLRAVLGDERLNYLGYSYGTFLGATYAELYPEKVGRLVLDGAIDPSASDFEVTKAQSVGFESALAAYLEDCLGTAECPFRGSVDGAMGEVRGLLDAADRSPVRGADGRMVGADVLLTAIIFPLYSQDSWPYLSQMFASFMQGDAELALQFADLYNGRNPDGSYEDNSTEAFRSINCLDYEYQSDVAVMRERAAELEAAAPIIGTFMSFGDVACASWPEQGDRPRTEIHAAGAPPILVIGTTNDPATPYAWAVALAEQLDEGVLVSYEGEGHTAYNKSNSCVNDAVEGFLVDGTVPAEDPRC